MATTREGGPGLNTWIAILATLSFRPMHGYEIRRELELRRVDRWAGVSSGSIYGRLRTLSKEGLIATMGSERVGARPARTVYRITPDGTDELVHTLRTALAEPQIPTQAVDLALSFCATADARLGAADLTQLLTHRRERLDELATELEEARSEPVSPQPGVAELVMDLLDHSLGQIQSEQRWVDHVLGRLEHGAYATPEHGALTAATTTGGPRES